MSPGSEPNVNPLIWAAIEPKRLLRFRYKNRERMGQALWRACRRRLRKAPSQLGLDDLDASLVGVFLNSSDESVKKAVAKKKAGKTKPAK